MSVEWLLLNYNQHFINLEIQFFALLAHFSFFKLSVKCSTIFFIKKRTILLLGKALFMKICLYYQSKVCSVVHGKMIPDYAEEKGSVQTSCLTVLIHRKPYLPKYNKISFQVTCWSFTIPFRII